jgi:glucosyl-3-phosphoglycerate phosphatase
MGPTTGMILIRHGQTEFNRVYSETRRDPGIRDPQLTAVGRSQAATVAQALGAMNPSRLIASPYTRALETAEIIAAELGLPISVEPLALLQARWQISHSRYRTERRCGPTPPGPTAERNRYFYRVRGEPR